MERAYKYRIYPTAKQVDLLNQISGSSRFVYNHYLNKRTELYQKSGASMSYNACSKDLTSLKKSEEFSWLKDCDSTALQSELKNLNSAFENFFRRVKSKKKPGYPKYKNKHCKYQSYTTKNNNGTIAIINNKIRIPKVGLLKTKISRLPEGRILSATISRHPSGKYFISLCCRTEKPEAFDKTDLCVGIDLGVKEFAITSDDLHIANPKYLRSLEDKLIKLQRELSRKKLHSNNYEKCRIKVACLHERIANLRNDFLHKLSTDLIRKYDVICLEHLAPSNMVKNHKMAKSVSDASWSEFVRMLIYKAEWYNKTIVQIDRFYPSSQLCHICGEKSSTTKDLKVRKWSCPACGTVLDRDVNAAINILNEGLRILNN